MPPSMGRRRIHNLDLPPGMHERAGRFYYGRNDIALGPDFKTALRKYADLHGGVRSALTRPTVYDAITVYQREELAKKAPKTQTEYTRQLACLLQVFGAQPLDDLAPGDVANFMRNHPSPISATREKALLSAVFNFARSNGFTNAANPCAGIRGKKSRRDRYIEDEEFRAVYDKADRPLRDFMDLAYLTGQRPSDVLKMTRQDIRDGVLRVRQRKTGARVPVAIVGPLAAVLQRVLAQTYPVQTMHLVLDETGSRMSLATMRRRFWSARKAAGITYQLRDIRAKAGSDLDSIRSAQKLLGHSNESTTTAYRRDRVGEVAQPVMRDIKSTR